MLGPGLALRGGEGASSMHKAVEHMKKESETCFKFFMAQLLFFHMSSFLLMWTLYSKQVAIIINVILGIFLIAFIKNGQDIYNKLAVSDQEAVSGKFTNFAQYEGMQDLDKDHRSAPIDTKDQRIQSMPNTINQNAKLTMKGNASFMGNAKPSQEEQEMRYYADQSN